jgi:hypothetical protein
MKRPRPRLMTILMTASLWFGAILVVAATGQESPNDIGSKFSMPPDSARPWVYWFWSYGNLTREGITADLEAIERVGIGGVLIMEVDQGIPKGPVRFASPEWRELFKHVVAEAARLGLEVNMNNDAGWNGSGGPWIRPEQAMQKVVFSETAVEGPHRFEGPLPEPKAVLSFYRDIAVLAFPTPADDDDPEQRFRINNIQTKAAFIRDRRKDLATFREPVTALAKYDDVAAERTIARPTVIDLTAKCDADGRLAWDVPAGKWTVLRVGHTPTGVKNGPSPREGCGLDCDKLSRDGIDAHFEGLMAKLIADVGPAAGKTLTYTHIDSWEVHSQNWTARMREEFQKRRGYDPLLLLPTLTGRAVDSLEVSERFLWDFRKTIGELLNENYAGRLRELAHQHGMQLSIEAYDDGPFDDLSYGGRADSPMGEFWMGGHLMSSCKEMASAAHTYGNTICGAESFTATPNYARWTNHPFELKALGDSAFCEGVNRFVFHRFAHQPWLDRQPGMTMGKWGIHYERTETWWEQTRPWHEYLARCNYLLRQGLFVADICYLQTEGSPNGMAHVAKTAYDFDACTPEVVLTRMAVRDGRLVLPDGMAYRLLVLPPSETMTPVLLEKIKELVEAGATVVGSPPLKSPSLTGYPRCDTRVRQLAAELWGDCDGNSITEHRLGKGKVVWGRKPEAVLAGLDVPPDFRSEVASGTTTLRYIHRAAAGTDWYFVANSSPHALDAKCTFRVKGKRPEFWSPETGRIEPAAIYDKVDDGTRVPIRLDPCGSVFVVFRPDSTPAADRVVEFSRDGKPVTAASRPVGVVVVKKAIYGVPGDANRTRDVTAKVQQLADRGQYVFQVSSLAAGDDPAYGTFKTLTLEYTLNGKPHRLSAIDTESVLLQSDDEPPAAELRYADNGQLSIEAWKPGRYELAMASGKTTRIEVPAPPQPVDVTGPWELRFPPGWGAPEHVALEKLISWTEHADPGVKFFSGTATYLNTLRVPEAMLSKDRRLYLDLGYVQVIAEVKLNGKDLGILWKPPFRVDVTDAVKVGDNSLEVRVVNLWPNRLIGDEQLPEDCKRRSDGSLVEWPEWLLEGKPSPTGRHTFATWRHWTKDSLLLESGLLGPVRLVAADLVFLER